MPLGYDLMLRDFNVKSTSQKQSLCLDMEGETLPPQFFRK